MYSLLASWPVGFLWVWREGGAEVPGRVRLEENRTRPMLFALYVLIKSCHLAIASTAGYLELSTQLAC